MNPAGAQPRAAHLITELVGDVYELGGARGFEPEPLRDHRPASSAPTRSSRTGLPDPPDAAAADSSSIALANATWSDCDAVSARIRDARARHRAPISRGAAGAARPPNPWSRSPASIRAAASASFGCAAASYEPTSP